jgi:hypothetical protein
MVAAARPERQDSVDPGSTPSYPAPWQELGWPRWSRETRGSPKRMLGRRRCARGGSPSGLATRRGRRKAPSPLFGSNRGPRHLVGVHDTRARVERHSEAGADVVRVQDQLVSTTGGEVGRGCRLAAVSYPDDGARPGLRDRDDADQHRTHRAQAVQEVGRARTRERVELGEVRIRVLPSRREKQRVREHAVDGVIGSREAAPLERACRHRPVAIEARLPCLHHESTEMIEVFDGERPVGFLHPAI